MSKPSKARAAKRAARKVAKKKKQSDKSTYWEYDVIVENQEGIKEKVTVIIADDSPPSEHLEKIKQVLKIGDNNHEGDNLVNDNQIENI